jgi:hypothetical protein
MNVNASSQCRLPRGIGRKANVVDNILRRTAMRTVTSMDAAEVSFPLQRLPHIAVSILG